MNLMPLRPKRPSTSSQLWNRDLLDLRDEVNTMMNNFFTQGALNTSPTRGIEYLPAVDIQEKDDQYLVLVDIPGMTEKDIELDLHDNILTITGERKTDMEGKDEGYYYAERRFGSFRRDIPFNVQVNTKKVKADLKNGTLHINIMKNENDKKNHKKIVIGH